MSDKIQTIDLKDVLSPSAQLQLSGVIMGDNLNDTLKINSMRVNKNTNEFYTPTLIIFNYVKYINQTQLNGVSNKKEYIRTAKNLLAELNGCGFYVGDEWRDNKKLPYAKGNSKLSKDTVIINLGPSSLCISKNLNLCDVCGVCYALTSERRYLNTLVYRLTQLIRFDELSADDITNQFKNLRVFKFLRVNESGDIFNLDDLFKLRSIAKKLYDKKGVIIYLYTHRLDLINKTVMGDKTVKDVYQTPFFKINRSGVDFNSLPSVSSNHKTLFCDGECKNCIYCKIELNTPVSALLHGDIVGDDLRDAETIKRDAIIKKVSYELWEMGERADDISQYVRYLLSLSNDADVDMIRDYDAIKADVI